MERIILTALSGIAIGALSALLITAVTRLIAKEWYETKKKIEDKYDPYR